MQHRVRRFRWRLHPLLTVVQERRPSRIPTLLTGARRRVPGQLVSGPERSSGIGRTVPCSARPAPIEERRTGGRDEKELSPAGQAGQSPQRIQDRTNSVHHCIASPTLLAGLMNEPPVRRAARSCRTNKRRSTVGPRGFPCIPGTGQRKYCQPHGSDTSCERWVPGSAARSARKC